MLVIKQISICFISNQVNMANLLMTQNAYTHCCLTWTGEKIKIFAIAINLSGKNGEID